MRIGFIFEGKPYKIKIPKVYVRGNYKEKIGIRVVYHFLKMVLSWTQESVVDMEKALMSSRMVELQGRSVSLGEASKALENGGLSSTLDSEIDNLPSDDREEEDIENTDFEVIS